MTLGKLVNFFFSLLSYLKKKIEMIIMVIPTPQSFEVCELICEMGHGMQYLSVMLAELCILILTIMLKGWNCYLHACHKN